MFESDLLRTLLVIQNRDLAADEGLETISLRIVGDFNVGSFDILSHGPSGRIACRERLSGGFLDGI